jgi:small subunit ribosomal protein S4e
MSHLKRLSTPPTWHIDRKKNIFIARPMPGGHSNEFSLTLVSVMRDSLQQIGKARELTALLKDNQIFVDGKTRTKSKSTVGIFDVISIPKIQENYRMMLDRKGRLKLIPIDEKEAKTKICKITGKRKIKGNEIQLSLHDGRTLITDIKAKVGDSVLLKLPEGKTNNVLHLQKGVFIYLIKGKHSGTFGVLQDIQGDKVIYETKNKGKVETLKKYAVVVGEKSPLITLENGKHDDGN